MNKYASGSIKWLLLLPLILMGLALGNEQEIGRLEYPRYITEFLSVSKLVGAVLVFFLVFYLHFLKKIKIKKPIFYAKILIICQLAIAIKYLLYDNWESFFVTAYSGVFVLLIYCGLFLEYLNNTDSEGIMQIFKDLLLINVILCLIAVFFYKESAYVGGGVRLQAFSANPQHLGMTLSLLVAVYLFLVCNIKEKVGFGDLILSAIASYLIVETGSRLSLIALIPSVVAISYRNSKVALCLLFILIIMIVFYLSDILAFFNAFFVDRGDTRSHVFNSEIERFLENPFFGAPIQDSGVIYFSESSLFTGVANLGVMFFAMYMILMFNLIRTHVHLVKVDCTKSLKMLRAGVLFAVFVLSLGEALFFGRFASYTILSIFALHLSQNISTARR